MSDELLIDRSGRCVLVTLNRPDERNAAGPSLLFELTAQIERLATDGDCHCLILTGAGKAFSAGGDFAHFVKTASDPEYAQTTLDNARRFIEAMLSLPMPVISAVNGAAVGFGATLAALSDIVLMSEQAFISEPHINVGLVVGDGIAVTWPSMLGLLRAKELIYTGRRVGAQEAVQLGLATRAVPHEQLLPEARALADELMRQPREALRETKALLNRYVHRNIDMLLDALFEAQAARMQGGEHGAIVAGLVARQRRNQPGAADQGSASS